MRACLALAVLATVYVPLVDRLANGEERSSERNSARAFGAAGDGIADDTKALQRAIDQSKEGVWLGKGTYRISKTLIVDLHKINRCSITGDGTATIVNEARGPAIRVVGRHEGTASPGSITAETWSRGRSPLLADFEVVGRGEESDGIEIVGVMQPTLRGLTIREARHAIRLSYNNRNVIISECHLFNNRGAGVFLDHVNLHQCVIGDCHLFGNRGGGIVVRGGNVRNVHIGNCDIESNMPDDGQASDAANVLMDVASTVNDPMPKDPMRSNPHTNTIAEVTIVGCTLQHTRKNPTGANVRLLGNEDYPINSVSIGSNVMSDAHVNLDLQHVCGVSMTGNHFIQSYPFDVRIRNSKQVSFSADQFTARLLEGERGQQNGSLIEASESISMTGVQFNGMINENAALRIADSKAVALSGCIFRDCRSGLFLQRCSDVTITGCIATGTHEDGEGYRREDCSNVQSIGNLLK